MDSDGRGKTKGLQNCFQSVPSGVAVVIVPEPTISGDLRYAGDDRPNFIGVDVKHARVSSFISPHNTMLGKT